MNQVQLGKVGMFHDANGKEYRLPEDEPIYWRISGYALVKDKDKLLTVIPTWNTLYELPGGGIEPAEDIKQGIIREVWEETGYKVEISQEYPFYFAEQKFYHRHHKKFYHSIIIIYQAELINHKQDKSVVNTQDGNEISSIQWQLLTKFTKDNTHWIALPAISKLLTSK